MNHQHANGDSASEPIKASLWLLWPIIIAGEAIFLLPFILPRLFRPSILEAWQISNLELGFAFSAYGLIAMICYGLGGPLADRFSPRLLMCSALISTAIGGLAMLRTPSPTVLCWLYAYFGMTTILLFWAAMLRVTHNLGGSQQQGTAFGILDAGRGLFAAVMATFMTLLFAQLLPKDALPTSADLLSALTWIVSIAITMVGLAAFLVAIAFRSLPKSQDPTAAKNLEWRSVSPLIRRPTMWLHGLIVLCAYCGYKSIDNYGIFAVDVYHATDVQASQLTTLAFWARPFAAIAAGLVADRLSHFKSLAVLFLFTASGNAALIFVSPLSMPWFGLLMIAVTTAAAVYGLRGIYFAVFDDLRIPTTLVGTAAGIISLVGFLPDVFFGPLTGYLLDSYPGRPGHQYVFGVVCLLSAIGMIAAIWNGKHLMASRHQDGIPA